MKIERVAIICLVVISADARKNALRGSKSKISEVVGSDDSSFIRKDVVVEPRQVPSGAAEMSNHLAQNEANKEQNAPARKRPIRRRAGSADALLVKGFGTDLCWKVRDGNMSSGNAIVLEECDGNDEAQHFERGSYHYDFETRTSSWFFRPRHADPDSDLYVAGYRENRASSWKMVLQELKYGITQPMTQVFWTIEGKNSENADIMGMGDHAYSTRLFVTNEGTGATPSVPVVLRTKDRIFEAKQSDTGEGSVIPGMWSYLDPYDYVE